VQFVELGIEAGGAAYAMHSAKQAGRCFPAGTLVATESGLRAIETIAIGEKVWSYDLVGREWVLCHVLQTFTRDYEHDLVFVTCGGETVESTFLHPYWVCEGEDLASRPVLEHHRGLMPDNCRTPGRWVDAGYLKVGDVLMLRDGRKLPIELVCLTPVHQTVYNFSVERLQNYAVGPLGLLVHNRNGKEATDEVTKGIKSPGRFDTQVKSLEDAEKAVQKAMPGVQMQYTESLIRVRRLVLRNGIRFTQRSPVLIHCRT
jgi:hypothetical protein